MVTKWNELLWQPREHTLIITHIIRYNEQNHGRENQSRCPNLTCTWLEHRQHLSETRTQKKKETLEKTAESVFPWLDLTLHTQPETNAVTFLIKLSSLIRQQTKSVAVGDAERSRRRVWIRAADVWNLPNNESDDQQDKNQDELAVGGGGRYKQLTANTLSPTTLRLHTAGFITSS